MGERMSRIFLCFMAYAVLGWCYEVFLEIFVYQWGFSNRGFLFGPYCPVYGFGVLLLLLSLQEIKQKRKWYSPIFVFFGAMLLTTSVELLTSYILELTTGGWMWDYTRYAIQFDGRIALHPSIRFGLGGVFILYFLQPLLEKLGAFLGEKAGTQLAAALFCVVLIDFIGSMVYRVW